MTTQMDLTNDELFIIMGMATFNMKDFAVFANKFKGYDRSKYTHKISLTKEHLDKLTTVCNAHKNQKGQTLIVMNKIKMECELLNAHSEYENKISAIKKKYAA